MTIPKQALNFLLIFTNFFVQHKKNSTTHNSYNKKKQQRCIIPNVNFTPIKLEPAIPKRIANPAQMVCTKNFAAAHPKHVATL